MPETPDETIEYPEYRDEPWYERGTVDPETGEEQTTDGYVDHLEQFEVRAPIVVESWSDLPANDPERVDHKTGQARQRYVLEHDLLVYDDGEEWRALGGLGSADRPLPEQHVESLHAGSAEIDNAPTDDTDALRRQDVESGAITIELNDFDQPADDSWGTFAYNNYTVDFETTFDDTPNITVTMQDTAGFVAQVFSVSPSSCQVRVFLYRSESYNTEVRDIYWIATV